MQLEQIGCSASTKILPAVNPVNFNLDFNSFQHVDLANGKLASPPAGPQSESDVWDKGSYTAVPQRVTNTWCLAALRENEPVPAVCP